MLKYFEISSLWSIGSIADYPSSYIVFLFSSLPFKSPRAIALMTSTTSSFITGLGHDACYLEAYLDGGWEYVSIFAGACLFKASINCFWYISWDVFSQIWTLSLLISSYPHIFSSINSSAYHLTFIISLAMLRKALHTLILMPHRTLKMLILIKYSKMSIK